MLTDADGIGGRGGLADDFGLHMDHPGHWRGGKHLSVQAIRARKTAL